MPEETDKEFTTQRIKTESVKTIKALGTSGNSFHEVLTMVLKFYKTYKNNPSFKRAVVGLDGRLRLSHLKGETIEYRVIE